MPTPALRVYVEHQRMVPQDGIAMHGIDPHHHQGARFDPVAVDVEILHHHPGRPGRGRAQTQCLVQHLHLAADRRRRLRAYSRHTATPPNLIIEWSADGTDYLSRGTSSEVNGRSPTAATSAATRSCRSR